MKDFIQNLLARTITRYVLIAVATLCLLGVVMAIVAISYAASNPEKSSAIVDSGLKVMQFVFASILPLLGTWIGTVLAYYFSKENFESANRSVQQIVDKISSEKKLQGVKAKDVMIPKDKLMFKTLSQGEDLGKFSIKDCLEFLKKEKIRRVIVLNQNDNALYVIHRDLISFFVANQSISGSPVADLTLKNMYADAELRSTIDNSVKFIGENSNLLEAKNIMEQYKTCQDVFITKNGNQNEPIIGWITNVTIMENSVV